MLDTEDTSKENLDTHLRFLNKLTNVSELVGLLILITPIMFISKQYHLFAVLALVTLLIISYLLQKTSFRINDFFLKLPTILCLGFAAGIIQLDPTPLFCVVLLAIISVSSMKLTEKLVFFLLFFVTGMLSFFVTSLLVTIEPVFNHSIINFIAVFSLFYVLGIHAFSWQYRYQRLSTDFRKSRNRFEHFMNLSNKLARYVPEQVWREVVQEKKDVVVENKRRKLTIFFSDIKGFTDLSESMSAEDLTFFLNDYFDSMSAIAKKHGATIDKCIGDALVIFFGDPHSKGEREDALACVEMAVDMNRELARLRNYWITLGFDGLHVRMGINTGYCHVGNFGSANRVSYTAIGREVNLAARIQDAARPNSIFISETTYELIKHRFLCQKGDKVLLKGIKEPTQLWEVRRHRQGDEIKDARWLEYNLSGFHLHLNMLNIKISDKVNIRNTLIKASRALDESIKKDKNQL